MNEEIKRKLYKLALDEYNFATANETSSPKQFYARPGRFIIERRRISDISSGVPCAPITLRTHPVNLAFPDHTHDYVEIMYAYSGSITHVIGERRICLNEGDTIILGVGTHHSIEPTGDGDLGLNIIISREQYEKLLSELKKERAIGLYPESQDKKDGYVYIKSGSSDSLSLAADALISTSLFDSSPDAENTRLALALFLSVLSGTCTERSAPDKNERLLEYIRSSYSTATLTEAAELLSLSPTYLSRLCSESLGSSFKELVMLERFGAAVGLLLNTDMKIGEIISAVGYENSSYFHKEFKKRYGLTPSEYRTQGQKNK